MPDHIKIPSARQTLSSILAKGTQLSDGTRKVVGSIGRRKRSYVESYATPDALPIEEMKAELGALQHIFASASGEFPSPQEYIDKMWVELTRTHRSWFLGALEDSKVQNGTKSPFHIYVSDKEDIERVRQEVRDAYEQVLGRIQRYRDNPKSDKNPNGEEPVIKIADVVKIEDGKEVRVKQLVPATEDNILKLEDIEVVRLKRDRKTGQLIPPPKDKHGLMYVPSPYIVPGDKFNEMYNWDSAFVIRGLLHSGEFEKAKFLVDDMLYQIEHYGTVLNGNRTNYMDRPDPKNPNHIHRHRSQPPLLTAKLLGIYKNYDALEEMSPQGGENKVGWLTKAMPLAERYHQFWMSPPHLAPALNGSNTSLSMYNSMREAPGDEVKYSEPEHYANALKDLTTMYNTMVQVVGNMVLGGQLDEKQEEIVRKNKFDRQKNIDELGSMTIKEIFAAQDVDMLTGKQKEIIEGLNEQQRKDLYYIEQYLDVNAKGKPKLSGKFMRGDWAMRESGFDPSRHFGFFNVDIINHIPVCLNSLRYKMESEMAELYEHLQQDDPAKKDTWGKKKKEWEQKANGTQAAMQELWDEGDGVRMPGFRDLNINDALLKKYNIPKFRDYDYATALFPMWAGVATEEQAQAIVEHIMPKLMSPYGLNTSNRENTGNQWDNPILWAPLQIVAMEALERYGYYEEAWKIGTRYSKMIMDQYAETGGMWEKAESRTGTVTNVWKFITNGYRENDKGFAWTNSAITEMMMSLPRLLLKMQGKKVEEPGVSTTEVVATGGRPVMPEDGHPVPQHSGGYEPLKLLDYEHTREPAHTR